jgi:hypothetical protein
MSNIAPILFIVLGFFLLFSGLNGTTGTALASLFTPSYVNEI